MLGIPFFYVHDDDTLKLYTYYSWQVFNFCYVVLISFTLCHCRC